MSGSFSQQLQDLLNPQPKLIDPEDDGDEETKARVVERFNEDEDEEGEGGEGLGQSVHYCYYYSVFMVTFI
uniref:Uncharacterized protein n=1 Tax=Neogobius melanostomus TaxID=47308 RepID=A0A8C6SB97_9GOBI